MLEQRATELEDFFETHAIESSEGCSPLPVQVLAQQVFILGIRVRLLLTALCDIQAPLRLAKFNRLHDPVQLEIRTIKPARQSLASDAGFPRLAV